MFSFKRADINEIPDIQRIAYETWPSAYEDLLGKEQVSYMLDLIYSQEALAKQFQDEHYFYFIYQDDKLAGFASFGRTDHSTWKLYKIYILPQMQGSGAGKNLLDFVFNKVTSLGATQLILNVNRHNKSRFFYEKIGFKIIDETNIEIGNGYFMDDFIMRISLSNEE